MVEYITLEKLKDSIYSHNANFKHEDLIIKHNGVTIFYNDILHSIAQPEYFENSDIKDILKRSKIIEPSFSFRDNHEFSSRYKGNNKYGELFDTFEKFDIYQIPEFFDLLYNITRSDF